MTNPYPKCGSPARVIGLLCDCWLPKERKYKALQWMMDHYNKRNRKGKKELKGKNEKTMSVL